MVHISTFVFFDIETTGLPYQEKNRTKITELSLVAASRKDIRRTTPGNIPPVGKLTFVLNPEKKISEEATFLTGISNEFLKYAPTFGDKINTLVSFLQELPEPVCLVAHNGNVFDYKILLAECIDAEISLPSNLLCVDSLRGFRELHKQAINKTPTRIKSELLTDDEDEWPELELSSEDYEVIDHILTSFDDSLSLENAMCHKARNCIKTGQTIANRKNKTGQSKKKNVEKVDFKLSSLYKRLLNKEAIETHRAEGDCMTLLQCVVAMKDFICWADNSCKNLSDIKPLKRY